MSFFACRGLTRAPWFTAFDLTLERGEVAVLSAPSGSGKTLLLRALAPGPGRRGRGVARGRRARGDARRAVAPPGAVRAPVPRPAARDRARRPDVAFWALRVTIGVEPWWTPRYSIPILGMILGNALNGVSLGLETALAGFARDRERVELLLAHGATRREASRDVVRRAVRTGTIPILNSMIAAGLIAIPGMMTGQILSGEPPMSAARYQILILFCIAGAVALGTIGVVLVAERLVFDERDRLRAERIERVSKDD